MSVGALGKVCIWWFGDESDVQWDHQESLDDSRGINYATDGSVIGIEILSPRRNGVLVDGLPFRDDVVRVMRSVGFRILEAARGA